MSSTNTNEESVSSKIRHWYQGIFTIPAVPVRALVYKPLAYSRSRINSGHLCSKWTSLFKQNANYANLTGIPANSGSKNGTSLCRRCAKENETPSHVLGTCPFNALLINTKWNMHLSVSYKPETMNILGSTCTGLWWDKPLHWHHTIQKGIIWDIYFWCNYYRVIYI